MGTSRKTSPKSTEVIETTDESIDTPTPEVTEEVPPTEEVTPEEQVTEVPTIDPTTLPRKTFPKREYKHSGNGRMVVAPEGEYLDHEAPEVQEYAWTLMAGGTAATKVQGFRTPRDVREARNAHEKRAAKEGTLTTSAIKARAPKAPKEVLDDEAKAAIEAIATESAERIEAIKAEAKARAEAAAAAEAEATEAEEATEEQAEEVSA